MRKIRILGVLTHFNLKKVKGEEKLVIGGVDYARVIQPLEHLDKDKFEVDITYEPIKKGGRFETVEDLAKYYDVCYFSYIDSVPFYIALKVAGMKYGMKMVLDLDDNIWAVDPTHPNYKGDFEPGSEQQFNRSAIIIDADEITTTNNYLRYEINKYTKRPIKEIAVMPNFIDLKKYDYKKIPKVKNDFTIGYIGGSSHFKDINKPEFNQAMDVIFEKYPHVKFKTTFYMPQLKARWGNRYQYALGRKSIYRFIDELWTQMMGECEFFVAPLSWSRYSRAKSYIKFLEYSAGKKASIMEKIDPYDEVLKGHPERGLQATTKDEWVKQISYLIDNPDKRKEIGENAYKYVKDNHLIEKGAKLYEKFFSKIVDKKDLRG